MQIVRIIWLPPRHVFFSKRGTSRIIVGTWMRAVVICLSCVSHYNWLVGYSLFYFIMVILCWRVSVLTGFYSWCE